jgi:3-hydroxyacyl-[acyl-carrier-protein] dehydratase
MSEQIVSIDSIPHRPPFLFIDSMEELGDDRIVTTKYVDPNLECFRGHYPGNPVMPGVLICECCFQAGALLIAHRRGGYDPNEGVPVLTRVQDARFRRIVRPGETLRVEVTIEGEVDSAYYLSGAASVDGELSVRVKFACMLARQRSQGH